MAAKPPMNKSSYNLDLGNMMVPSYSYIAYDYAELWTNLFHAIRQNLLNDYIFSLFCERYGILKTIFMVINTHTSIDKLIFICFGL